MVEQQTHAEHGHVSVEEYMDRYAAFHFEWVDGKLVMKSPVSDRHKRIVDYLYASLNVYGGNSERARYGRTVLDDPR